MVNEPHLLYLESTRPGGECVIEAGPFRMDEPDNDVEAAIDTARRLGRQFGIAVRVVISVAGDPTLHLAPRGFAAGHAIESDAERRSGES